MSDELRSDEQRQEKKTRDWYKCSDCRQRKIKCEPQNRDWVGKQTKCDFCQRHKLPCSQNYKKKDDPGVERAANGQLVPLEHGSSQSSQESAQGSQAESSIASAIDPSATAPAGAIEYGVDTEGWSSTGTSPFKDRRLGIQALTEGELKAKALSKLERLKVLGIALMYHSQLAPVPCQALGTAQDYNHMSQNIASMVKEELHALFVCIYELGSLAVTRGHDERAQEIFLKLQLALERYPGLCDGRKRGALLKMAAFFQNHDDQCESEHILGKVADMHGTSAHPLHESPCPLLAKSYYKTSEKARQILANLWQKTYGFDDVPTNLAMPPLERAAQMANGEVASVILSHPEGIHSDPSMLDQQALHIAAALGHTHTLHLLINAGQIIDSRDSHNRTPLFLAASNGHDSCCLTLLMNGADQNSRDSHGHTVLEVAAQGGFLAVVRHLVHWGAEINPPLTICASTPLQAAIQSDSFSLESTYHLIDNGADIGALRFDRKTAIDLAEARGFTVLAQTMRQKKLYLESQLGQVQQSPFCQNQLSPTEFGAYSYLA